MNISLIGMMGSGKSTIGKLLAENLSFSFIDTDEEIVRLEKTSINEIFEKKGEDYFRQIEKNVLEATINRDNIVISTGGGIVKFDDNIQLLKEKSKVFYLKVRPEILYNRVKNNSERPLLNVDDMKNRIINLLNERNKKYEQAHVIINAEQEPEIVVKEIIENIL